MILPTDTIVAVADGEKLNLFRNTGTETELSLAAAPEEDVEAASGSGGHNNSSSNPDQSQANENDFASGIVGLLNSKVLTNKFSDIVIIAAPKTLGEMRKHYHKKLEEALVGEIAKDLTGHSIADIEKTIIAA
jgi:protein required for attachment to host cells